MALVHCLSMFLCLVSKVSLSCHIKRLKQNCTVRLIESSRRKAGSVTAHVYLCKMQAQRDLAPLRMTNAGHAVTVLPSEGAAFSAGIYSATTCSLKLVSTETRTIPFTCPELAPMPSAEGKRSLFLGTRSLLLDSFFPRRGTTAAPAQHPSSAPPIRPVPFHSVAAKWRS